jgi:hypothetical protein
MRNVLSSPDRQKIEDLLVQKLGIERIEDTSSSR